MGTGTVNGDVSPVYQTGHGGHVPKLSHCAAHDCREQIGHARPGPKWYTGDTSPFTHLYNYGITVVRSHRCDRSSAYTGSASGPASLEATLRSTCALLRIPGIV